MSNSTGNILVVEDDAVTRELLRDFLRRRGFTVVEACNGVEAIETATRVLPKIILLDLFMPLKDGYAAAQQIRWVGALRLVPIIVMSAYGDQAIKFFKNIDVLGGGPIEYLPKPFDPLHLADLLEKYA